LVVESRRMSKPQRIVLVIYCFLLAYCCVWIPWHVTLGYARTNVDVIYSFVWAAPNFGFVRAYSARPAMQLIFLRIVAITAVAGAVFVIVGTFKPAT
jgi:hypothetical protein